MTAPDDTADIPTVAPPTDYSDLVDDVRKIVADGGDTDDVDPEDLRAPARRTPGLAYSRTLLNVADLEVGPPAVLTDRLSTRR
jgi:hypothetical protein